MPSAHELPLPDPPDRIGTLDAPSDTLVHGGPAGHRPFLAASRRIEVHGTESGGVDRVVAEGAEVLLGLRTGGGPCANVLLGPRGVRRELVGPGGTVLETLLVADRHPGVVIQWTTTTAGGLALDVRWDVPGRSVAQRSSGPILRVRTERGPDRLFALFPGTARWEMDAGPDGLGVRVRVRAHHEPVTLMAGTVASNDDGSALLRILGRSKVLENRTEAFLTNVRQELLRTRTGVAEIDDGLAWAVARTAGAHPLHRSAADPLAPSLARVWMVAGALAAGDVEGARSWIDAEPVDPAGALALGWWVRWTGDTAPFRRHRDATLEVLSRDRSRSAAGRAHSGAVGRAARTTVAEALEALGDEAVAASLRRTAANGPAMSHEAGTPGVTLPMLGDSTGIPTDEAVLAMVLGGPEAPASDLSSLQTSSIAGVSRALRVWALYAADRSDEAYVLLRDHLAEGVRHGDPLVAALVPAAVLHGLLGAGAEAPWGRLRLAPALPSGWTRFTVEGIRVGDARVSLRYARREGSHTFSVEQTTGRVPLSLVFEPSVPGAVEAVRVDGGPTDVAPDHRGGRARVRLQLPLDAERRVTLVGSQA